MYGLDMGSNVLRNIRTSLVSVLAGCSNLEAFHVESAGRLSPALRPCMRLYQATAFYRTSPLGNTSHANIVLTLLTFVFLADSLVTLQIPDVASAD